MARIIRILNDVIVIGKDDGTITEARIMDLNFMPVVGDEVEVFQSETQLIVSKKENRIQNNPQEGININISNNNNNNNDPSASYIANGKKAVNKIVYCILAFFLGGIGIHKFYAGRIGTGILFIIFSWTFIPAFIAFVEFVVALCKQSDPNGNILV